MLAIGALCASGCFQQRQQGGETLYRFHIFLVISLFAVGFAAGIAGWLIRKKSRRLGYGFLVFAILDLGVAAPSIALDETRVGEKHFAGRYGPWWALRRFSYDYRDLMTLRLIRTEKGERWGKPAYLYELECTHPTGEVEVLAFNTTLDEAGLNLLRRAGANGVQIEMAPDRVEPD